jgi:hypothetical protein
MLRIELNNKRVFNKSIIAVLAESPELLGLDEDTFNFLNNEVTSEKDVFIVNDYPSSPKENYDIFFDDNYVGNIILLKNQMTEFWEIDILIFSEYRRKGYAKIALDNLINLYPDRNWEANILSKNKSINVLQTYFLDLGFEKVDHGMFNSEKEIVYNYQKSKDKIITVIASAYFEPISDLLNNLLKRSNGRVNDVQTSIVENGYCVALCILLVACFESYIMRDIYFKKDAKIKTPLQYLRKYHNNFPYLEEVTECYVIRDLLLHNHIWEIEHSSIGFKIINSSIMPFSGDTKFEDNVDLSNRVTNKLKLNIIPTRINRTDVKQVLKTIWESLNYFSTCKDSEIYLTFIVVIFDGRVHNFKEVYEKFMERV